MRIRSALTIISFFLFMVSLAVVAMPAVFAEEAEVLRADTGSRTVYGLTLEAASRLALKNSLDMQLVRYDVYAARTRLADAESIYDVLIEGAFTYQDDQSAKTSTILGSKATSNDYSLSAQKTFSTGTTVTFESGNIRNWTNSVFSSLNPSHDASIGVTMEQDLGKNFLGRLDRGEIRLTRFDIQNVRYTSFSRIETLLADVQKAYWDLALAEEQVQIEEQLLEQATSLWKFNKEQFSHGMVERPDVLAAEANVRRRENQLLLLQNQRQTKENVLKLLLNIQDDDAHLQAQQDLDAGNVRISPELSWQTAFSSRRDYLELKNRLEAQDVDLEMKENALWPEIHLSASLARNGVDDKFAQAFEKIGEEDNPDLVVGLTFKFPLQNSSAKSQLDRSKIEKAQLLVALKLLERQMAIGIADQVRTCRVTENVVWNAANIAGIQQEKLKAEQQRFDRGRSDTDTLIRFQEDLFQARLSEAEAKFQYQRALIELRRLEGALLESFGEEIF